jgi:hypothetical protein
LLLLDLTAVPGLIPRRLLSLRANPTTIVATLKRYLRVEYGPAASALSPILQWPSGPDTPQGRKYGTIIWSLPGGKRRSKPGGKGQNEPRGYDPWIDFE